MKRQDSQVGAVLGRYGENNDNDIVLGSVIAWSFYPKLLKSEGKGWRSIANNQFVKLHPSSLNKVSGQQHQWLSFYHIMQSNSKAYNAHETNAVESFGVALVCGDADFKASKIHHSSRTGGNDRCQSVIDQELSSRTPPKFCTIICC